MRIGIVSFKVIPQRSFAVKERVEWRGVVKNTLGGALVVSQRGRTWQDRMLGVEGRRDVGGVHLSSNGLVR